MKPFKTILTIISSALLLIFYFSSSYAQSNFKTEISNLNTVISSDPNLDRKCLAVEALQGLCISQNLDVSYDAFEAMLNVLKVPNLNRYFVTINSEIQRLLDNPVYQYKILDLMTHPAFVKRFGDVFNFPIALCSDIDIKKLDQENYIARIVKMDELVTRYYPAQNSKVYQLTNDYYFSRCKADTFKKYLPTILAVINAKKDFADFQGPYQHRDRSILNLENYAFVVSYFMAKYYNNGEQLNEFAGRYLLSMRDHFHKFSDTPDGRAAEDDLFDAFDKYYLSGSFPPYFPYFALFSHHKAKAIADLNNAKTHAYLFPNYRGITQKLVYDCQAAIDLVNR